MKYIKYIKYITYLLLLLPLASFSVFAIDPNDEPEITLDCDAPLERTDGTAIVIGEIVSYQWYISQDKTTWDIMPLATGINCNVITDITGLSDGNHYYTPDVTLTDGKTSVLAYEADPLEVVTITVKRIADPRNPTGARRVLN